MRFIILSCLAATAALAGPSPHEWARNNKGVAESLDGVTWAPLAWDAQAFPGGPKLTLRGTVQEVHDQLLAANPEWETDFARNTTSESPTHDERSANFMGAKVECKEWKYGQPKHAALLRALNHWNNVAGPGPVLAPGPSVCSVVYYDSDTTIVLCNAVSHFSLLYYPMYGTLACESLTKHLRARTQSKRDSIRIRTFRQDYKPYGQHASGL